MKAECQDASGKYGLNTSLSSAGGRGGAVAPDTAKGSSGMLKFARKSKGRKVKPEAGMAAGRGGQEFGHCAGQMFGQTGSGVGVAP